LVLRLFLIDTDGLRTRVLPWVRARSEKGKRKANPKSWRATTLWRLPIPRRLDQNSRITFGVTAVFDFTAYDGMREWKPFCECKTHCFKSLYKETFFL
jgi:hypothetical protein